MNSIKLAPIKIGSSAIVKIPGSKSYTNRALIMAALSNHAVIIKNPLFSDDTEAMIDCLKKLGTKIEVETNSLKLLSKTRTTNDTEYSLNARLSGTTIRFILALLIVIPGTKILTGHEGLIKRPIKELVYGLRQLGAHIDYLQSEGFPPVKIHDKQLHSGTAELDGDISSQYFSALMMIAPLIGDITIKVVGNQISKSYIDMTIDTMRQFGVTVINDNYQKYNITSGQSYKLKEYTVEGDFSAAGYFFAIAALTNSNFTLKNLNPESKQGDLQFVRILEQMGSKIISGKNEIQIIGKGLSTLEVDMELCPDQAQTMAVLAAFVPGRTILRGVRSLRVKETERVKATQTELAKMDIKTLSPDNDTLIVFGGNPRPAIIDTYGDHRMAMSFAVAGAKLPGMIINNPDVVNKTFPDFWQKLKDIGMIV